MTDEDLMTWLDPLHGYSAVMYGRRCHARWNYEAFRGWLETVYAWAEDGTNAMFLPGSDFTPLGDGAQHEVVFVLGARASTVCAATCAPRDSWNQGYDLDERGLEAMAKAGKRAMKHLTATLSRGLDPEDPSSLEPTDQEPGFYLLSGSGVREARLLLGRALAPGEVYQPTGRIEVHRPRGPEGEHPFVYAGVVIAYASHAGDPAVRLDLSARALKPLRALPELVDLMRGDPTEFLLAPSA